MRLHRKVWVWWGRWWAVQLVWLPWEAGLGIWCEPRRPLIDFHLLWFTVSLGNHPALSDDWQMHVHSGRGFLGSAYPDGKRL